MNLQQVEDKEKKLIDQLSQLDSVIVAYSGGVDSSVLAYYARVVLKEKAAIAIAISPSLSPAELQAARAQAKEFDWNLIEITTDEVDLEEYKRNDLMRCFFCKSTLFEELEKLRNRLGIQHLTYGANQDDLQDFRPGNKAAREHNVLSPLQTAGLNKEEIRALARKAGLPSWNRPQAACLSSRFPAGQPISVELLTQVDQAEQYLRSLNFRQVRVRHQDNIARIELGQDELPRLVSEPNLMDIITTKLNEIGYTEVILDKQGYRQGGANQLASLAKEQ